MQFLFLLFLLRRDRNDGERELFIRQKFKPSDVLIVILSIGFLNLTSAYLASYQFTNSIIVGNPYILYLLFSVVILVLFKFKIKQSIGSLGFRINSTAKNIFLSIILALICYLLFLGSYRFLGLEPDLYIFKAISKLNSVWYYVTYSFTFIILGPFVEEIIFRGISYSPYRKKYGPLLAIIFTSLIFSFAHGASGLILILVQGLFLGFLYERTESIFPCFFAHGTLNLLLCLTPFLHAFD